MDENKKSKESEKNDRYLIELYNNFGFKDADISTPETRWQLFATQILKICTKIITNFFYSRTSGDDMANIRSLSSSYIRKYKSWNEFKNNKEQQDIFMLGYFYSISELLNAWDVKIENNENMLLKNLIEAYKYLEPCVTIIDNEFQVTHSELAKHLNISETSLSNFMSRVSSYGIFDSTIVGRKRYYSLAYPNGKILLSIINKKNTPNINHSTSFLESVMSWLHEVARNEITPTDVTEKCQGFTHYNNIKKIENIATKLNSPCYRLSDLLEKENNAQKYVVIYTKDIKGESLVNNTVVKNLERNIIYYYLLLDKKDKSEQTATKTQLIKCLKPVSGFKNSFSDKIRVISIQTDELDNEFKEKIKFISDIISYDGKCIFISESKKITNNTLYRELDNKFVELFKEKILNKISPSNE